MRAVPLCLLLTLLATPGAPARAQMPGVDVALVLAADGSGSIDEEEFRLQRAGYATAITDPTVLAAIGSGYHGAIALAYMEWGAPESQHTIVDWMVIDGAAAAQAFADKLLAAPRVAFGYNSISNALHHAGGLLRQVPAKPLRHIIDVSGDGPQMNGMPLFDVRAALLADGVTINALVVISPGGGYRGSGGEPLDEHYRRDVIGGPGAFVKSVKSRAEMAEALKEKLVLEIAGTGATPGDDGAVVMRAVRAGRDNM